MEHLNELYQFTATGTIYTITLADGTKLENLELNGNNFILDEKIEDIIFEDNLQTITISDGENEYTFTDILLLSNRVDKLDGRTWFVLGEKTKEQKEKELQEAEKLETEQFLTEMDLRDIEKEQAMTDMDLRLTVLEGKYEQ